MNKNLDKCVRYYSLKQTRLAEASLVAQVIRLQRDITIMKEQKNNSFN
ncbi:MAG: hypothetical protein SFU91_05595 [Chloroherpetonaceae bacterium]|nr:hypothetical protein [Chloroherpetonaceae bacterium]